MNENTKDILIVGGGINGVAIAAEAAMRGLSVVLCEQSDLSSQTSSASSKLIHGGLRYLEQLQLSLVKQSLSERNILLSRAPHLVRKADFIFPHDQNLRSMWKLRVGFSLYDLLATSSLVPKSRLIDLHHLNDNPLKASYSKAFKYVDCQTDDSRLVVANALAASELGASILTYTRCIAAIRRGQYWVVKLKNSSGIQTVYCKCVVNCTGANVNRFLSNIACVRPKYNMRLIKGSHIVVKKFYPGPQAFVLQLPDDRIIFVLPYVKDMLLIGTTDILYHGQIEAEQVTLGEINYLISAVNHYFKQQLSGADVIWKFAGLRVSSDDSSDKASTLSRKHQIAIDTKDNTLPLLSVYGGKLTTHRLLAKRVIDTLKAYLPYANNIDTSHIILPGGNFNGMTATQYFDALRSYNSWLDAEAIERMFNSYGSWTEKVLDGATSINDMGEYYGAGLYEREVAYLKTTEWIHSINDLLWRRSKLGLLLTPEEVRYIQKRCF